MRVEYIDQRRQSRMAALQSLFAADVRGIWNDPPLEWLDEDEELPESSVEFAEELLQEQGMEDVAGFFAGSASRSGDG